MNEFVETLLTVVSRVRGRVSANGPSARSGAVGMSREDGVSGLQGGLDTRRKRNCVNGCVFANVTIGRVGAARTRREEGAEDVKGLDARGQGHRGHGSVFASGRSRESGVTGRRGEDGADGLNARGKGGAGEETCCGADRAETRARRCEERASCGRTSSSDQQESKQSVRRQLRSLGGVVDGDSGGV